MTPTQLDRIEKLLTEIKDDIGTGNLTTAPEPGRAVTIDNELAPGDGPLETTRTDDPQLSDAITQYLGLKAHEVSPQHLEGVRLILRQFGNPTYGSDLPVSAVTKPHVVAYRQGLIDAGRSNKTITNHITILVAFFNWAFSLGYCHANPAFGLKLRNAGRASTQRKAFTPELIERVFTGFAVGESWQVARRARRWLPLIMLFTGARPEEVAQLRVGDVHQTEIVGVIGGIKGVWVFDFTTVDNGQRRKSEASRRLVPVHPRLWELGLAGLLGPCRDVIEAWPRTQSLFPELTPGASGRLAEAPSRWFNRKWLRDCKAISDPKLVLYSLRHSVATSLKHKGVSETLISELLGHSTNGKMSTGRYGKEYPVAQLYDAVCKLDWAV